ncbi:hypothetical protein HO133_009584 [Letharia lupina]|uniref:Uncharacterized protein n=1 Tax=Letharia lupina TaxID=560253 RepID=A0A8H6CL93_9LECA|nr:uncharacterized protein HO133_009584 [Letharia lupina]KAF6225584.1 hypothetical protein HO133_009584 [Letharia lupina]
MLQRCAETRAGLLPSSSLGQDRLATVDRRSWPFHGSVYHRSTDRYLICGRDGAMRMSVVCIDVSIRSESSRSTWETWRRKIESELLGGMEPATVKFSFILGGMFVAILTLGRRRVGIIQRERITVHPPQNTREDLLDGQTSAGKTLQELSPGYKCAFPSSHERCSLELDDIYSLTDPSTREELQADVGFLLSVIHDETKRLNGDASRIVLTGIGQVCATGSITMLKGQCKLGGLERVDAFPGADRRDRYESIDAACHAGGVGGIVRVDDRF